MIPAKVMSLRRPYGTPENICGNLFPHITTPRNKDHFLGTPVTRGANKHCAYGAAARTLLMRFSIKPAFIFIAFAAPFDKLRAG